MFQLIYLTFTAPRADATVFKVLTDQMKTMLASQQASPEYVFSQTLRTTLAQNHFRARPLTPELLKEMDLQKSFAFYKDRFADASDFTFVFAGSFDVAAIKPLVEQYLGSLPSIRRKETWRNVGITPPTGVVEKVVRKGIEPKSQVDLVFTGAAAYDVTTRVALDALAVVLETRLREKLREALGGTYGVQVDANATKVPEPRYSVTIDFGCDPQRTEELVKALFKEIDALKASRPDRQGRGRRARGAHAGLRERPGPEQPPRRQHHRRLRGRRGPGRVLRPAVVLHAADAGGHPGRGAAVPGHEELRPRHAAARAGRRGEVESPATGGLAMNEAERIWQEKSDDALIEAAAELETYTDEGQRIIRAELKRRGLEDPVEQAQFTAVCAWRGAAGA